MVRFDTGQQYEKEHVGVGHEAADIVEGIPSWSHDGAPRHASNASRNWVNATVRHQVAGTNENGDKSNWWVDATYSE